MHIRLSRIVWGKSAALAGLVLTGACASGTSGLIPDPYDFATAGEAISGQAALFDEIQKSEFSPTNSQQMPTTGSVGYQGFVQFATAEQAFAPADDALFAIGRVALTASFSGNGGITGTADNFIDGNDHQMTGQMTISASTLSNDTIGAGFSGLLQGRITSADNFEFNYTVPTGGYFLGPNAEFIEAGGYGDFTNTDTGVVTPFEVGIVVQQ